MSTRLKQIKLSGIIGVRILLKRELLDLQTQYTLFLQNFANISSFFFFVDLGLQEAAPGRILLKMRPKVSAKVATDCTS